MNYGKVPKIELHCHLDGSLRPETVLELIESSKDTTEKYLQGLGENREARLQAVTTLLVAPYDCDSLDTYLKRFELPIYLMQTEEVLERVAFELMEDCAKEAVKYVEIRFAPQLHTEGQLDYDRIIGSVVKGVKSAEQIFEIRGNVILSYMRNSDVEGIYSVLDAGKPYLGKGVVAIDLCAGERDLFAPRFKEAMGYARKLGYHVTIHAGETGITQNIVDAIEILGAERIGHGVAMMNSSETRKKAVEQGIFIECCPTSNLQTKAVEKIKDHPILSFEREGLLITLNTDNRTVSNTSMTGEFECLEDAFDIEPSFCKRVYENALKGSFASSETKVWLGQFKIKAALGGEV